MLVSLMDIDNVFQDTYNELKNTFSCTYMFYQYQYQNFKLVFATHQEWTDVYINESLIKNCALIRVGLQKIATSKTNNVVLRWNDVLPISREETNTAMIRADFNICNGISFGRKIQGFSDYFGLATDTKHFDFPRDIVSNSTKVRNLMDNLFRASTIKLFYRRALNISP